MSTPRQPGLQGNTQSRADNIDSGRPADEREALERAQEGRSRKAADNASNRISPAERRAGWTETEREIGAGKAKA